MLPRTLVSVARPMILHCPVGLVDSEEVHRRGVVTSHVPEMQTITDPPGRPMGSPTVSPDRPNGRGRSGRTHTPTPTSTTEPLDGKLTDYPGEAPGLLREAFGLLGANGCSELAEKLRWAPDYLLQILGEAESRPQLTLVP